jgi:LacI family transcriptional regulator
MVTRADVARRAGTSTAVVSYVINNGPRPVARETKARVLKAIDELGYRPNLVAQALRGFRSRVIGLIVPDIANPFYAELARAIENAAEPHGYTLIFGNSEQQAEREINYLRTFVDRQVDGVLLVSGSNSRKLAKLFAGLHAPHVLLDRSVNYTPNTSLLTADGFEGAAIATRHLLKLGHRRIHALCGPAHMGSDRANGYVATMAEADLEATVHHAEAFGRKKTYDAAMEMLSRGTRPTAVFASNDIAGISTLRAAADLRMRTPEDLAIVAFDDIQEGQYSVPRLTTVAQPIDELGRLATEQLIALIHDRGHGRIKPSKRFISPRLIIRESCGGALRC